jgi:NADP-dependent 3-hydroxy acid dehydrogenase YdfG
MTGMKRLQDKAADSTEYKGTLKAHLLDVTDEESVKAFYDFVQSNAKHGI